MFLAFDIIHLSLVLPKAATEEKKHRFHLYVDVGEQKLREK